MPPRAALYAPPHSGTICRDTVGGTLLDTSGHHFWDGFGNPLGTSWGIEKAGFGEARLSGTRQQPLWFGAHLGSPFLDPGDSILEMDFWTLLMGQNFSNDVQFLGYVRRFKISTKMDIIW